jgi:uncharacterized membrane protein YhhN
MSYYVIGFALMVAAADWIAVANKWKVLKYFAKPSVIVLLITWLVINGGFQGPTMFFIIGLLFSLAGDIFLMLPDEKFLAGLFSFLVAHLAYIRGFAISGFGISTTSIVIIVLVGLVGFGVLRQILKCLKAQHQEKLRFPVTIYAIVICIMLVSALLTMIIPGSVWNFYPSLLVSIGATLFFLSDMTLAWNKFVRQVTHGGLLIIITYHLAQITITLGTGLNFLY